MDISTTACPPRHRVDSVDGGTFQELISQASPSCTVVDAARRWAHQHGDQLHRRVDPEPRRRRTGVRTAPSLCSWPGSSPPPALAAREDQGARVLEERAPLRRAGHRPERRSGREGGGGRDQGRDGAGQPPPGGGAEVRGGPRHRPCVPGAGAGNEARRGGAGHHPGQGHRQIAVVQVRDGSTGAIVDDATWKAPNAKALGQMLSKQMKPRFQRSLASTKAPSPARSRRFRPREASPRWPPPRPQPRPRRRRSLRP